MAYDGSIIIDTHIDTGGISSGTKDVNRGLSSIGKGADDAARALVSCRMSLTEQPTAQAAWKTS